MSLSSFLAFGQLSVSSAICHYFNNIRRASRSLNLIPNNGYSKVHWSQENLTASGWNRTFSTIFKSSFDCWRQNHFVPILYLDSDLLTLSLFKSYGFAEEITVQPVQAYPSINDQSGVPIDQWTFSMYCLSVVIRKEVHSIAPPRKAHYLAGCMNSILSVDLASMHHLTFYWVVLMWWFLKSHVLLWLTSSRFLL